MKDYIKPFYAFSFIILLFATLGCTDDCETTVTDIYYEPVFSLKSEVRNSVTIEPGREISTRGKIFFKDGYLFINEPKNGIHVIDNRQPTDPQNIAFIKVPGSFDIVVKDNLLFTDSYMDLVTFDISNLQAITEVNRMEDFFTAHGSLNYYNGSDEEQIVTDWTEERRTTSYKDECNSNGFFGPTIWLRQGEGFVQTALDNASAGSAGSAPGIAGSLARFALTGEHLYALDGGWLKNLELTSPLSPISGEDLYVSWDVETLFPRGDELFVGASGGMHILDISNRSNPQSISLYEHINSCDPVIVEGDLAFVTLRSGTECQGFTDQLEVIDISDLRNPRLLHTFPMHNPHGLSKDGDALFICDGDAGLKVFNSSDLSKIGDNLLAHDGSIQAYDIIAFNNIAMLIGDDGLHQYDYSDLNDIKLLSTIKILP